MRAEGPIDLQVRRASVPSASAASSAALADFRADVSEGKLTVRVPGDERVAVELGLPVLDAVELLGSASFAVDTIEPRLADGSLRISAYGSSRARIGAIAATRLDLRASGDAQIAVDDVTADELVVLANGRAAVRLAGAVETARFETGGQAELSADALKVQDLRLTADGRSRASVWATAHLDGEARGASRVGYRGGPDVAIEIAEDAELKRSGQ